MSLLHVDDLTSGHGEVAAVHNVSVRVDAGEMVALLGANGAGKTTILHSIAGLLPVMNGSILFDGTMISGQPSHKISRLGLSLLPQDRGLFFQLTVAENLRLHQREEGNATLEDVVGYFPALGVLMSRKAGLLSGGEQQMLALGCRIIAGPRLLLIDEMSLGLAPIIFKRMLPVLGQIASDKQIGVLLVEQHVHLALKASDRAYVLNRGRITYDGSAKDLSSRPEFLETSYLGRSPD
ncbi:MAG: hypothetical protein RL119_739 [Actinomycetota bacterium]|jgi:branched-chain amino acid transport system ATP-binding protein